MGRRRAYREDSQGFRIVPFLPVIARSIALALPLWAVAALAGAAGLTYRIEGASAALRENLRAHLGPSPDTQEQAERFLITAPRRAAEALEALGYYRSTLALEHDEARGRVILRVDEGAPLTYTRVSVRCEGEGADDPRLSELIERLAPAIGDPVHHGVYETLKTELRRLARSRGYFDESLRQHRIDIDVGESRAELTLVYATGVRYRFGALVHDSAMLDAGIMQALRPFETGEPYRQSALLELRQRLLRLGYFSSVVVAPELARRRTARVPVRVDLTPMPRHSYEVGLGYSTDTRQRLSLIWRSPRLGNRGHSQQTALRWSPVNPEWRSVYSVPMDAAANDVLQFAARREDNEYGDLDSRQGALEVRREWTGERGVRALSLEGLSEAWSVFDKDFSARFLLAGASASRRTWRGSALDPRGGSSRFYSLRAAARDLGSDEDALRLYGRLTGVRRFSEHWRLLARGELGMLWSSSGRPDELPPSLAFFAGGDNSIRGFGYQSIGQRIGRPRLFRDSAPQTLTVGANRLLTGSVEIQRYFGKNWRAALFVDAGDAFLNERFDLNVGVGLGIHYLSPLGALRLEIADPVSSDDKSWRVHINIGAEF